MLLSAASSFLMPLLVPLGLQGATGDLLQSTEPPRQTRVRDERKTREQARARARERANKRGACVQYQANRCRCREMSALYFNNGQLEATLHRPSPVRPWYFSWPLLALAQQRHPQQRMLAASDRVLFLPLLRSSLRTEHKAFRGAGGYSSREALGHGPCEPHAHLTEQLQLPVRTSSSPAWDFWTDSFSPALDFLRRPETNPV